ncbi:unnamed protein product [Rotaria sp. Silwood2]|nr:unnamed protein product [Rotaria sp. Silwood2]CAF4392438.1 unnamed protein product [Rotaria sp. Silwood2]CAF4419679.1 unnamed protein product [Rotaria sp. Silwood2]
MHNLLGVSLVHNHFQLNDGEYVETAVKSIDIDVEQLMGNYSTNGHSFVFHTKASTSSSSSMNSAVPYMWAYDKTTNAYFPTQSFDGNNNKIVERLTKLCDRINLIEFLNEYKVELMKYGLENDLVMAPLMRSPTLESSDAAGPSDLLPFALRVSTGRCAFDLDLDCSNCRATINTTTIAMRRTINTSISHANTVPGLME